MAIRSLFLLVALHLAVLPRLSLADATSNAVVRLSAESAGGCGSGFFIDDGATVVTNIHVADLLCHGNRCEGVKIERSQAGTEFENVFSGPVDLQVSLRLSSLDLAFLTLPEGKRSNSSLTFADTPPLAGTPVELLGFPSCGPLSRSSGVISDIDSLTFSSGASGASGSSGGPILQSDGKVIGVAFQADSFVRALYDKFNGGSFTLKAVRADTAVTLRKDVSARNRLSEIQKLITFYDSDVRPAIGLKRVMRAMHFLNTTRVLSDTIAHESSDPDLLRSAALLDHFPGTLLQLATVPPQGTTAEEFEKLIFTANIESRGPFSSFTEPLTRDLVKAELTKQGRTTNQIDALLDRLPKEQDKASPGLVPLGAITGIAAAVGIILLLLAWGWSAGYVYARAHGGRLRRFVMMIAVAILLWPISLIVFRLSRKFQTNELAQ